MRARIVPVPELVFNFPHGRLTTQTAGLGLRNRAIIRAGRAFYSGRTIKPVPSLSGNVRSTSDQARTGAPVSGRSVRGWIIIFRRNERDLVVTNPISRFTPITLFTPLIFQNNRDSRTKAIDIRSKRKNREIIVSIFLFFFPPPLFFHRILPPFGIRQSYMGIVVISFVNRDFVPKTQLLPRS